MAGMIVGKAPSAAAASAAETALAGGSILGVDINGYVREGLYFAVEFTTNADKSELLYQVIEQDWTVLCSTGSRPQLADLQDDSLAMLHYACGRLDAP